MSAVFLAPCRRRADALVVRSISRSHRGATVSTRLHTDYTRLRYKPQHNATTSALAVYASNDYVT